MLIEVGFVKSSENNQYDFEIGFFMVKRDKQYYRSTGVKLIIGYS